LYPPPPPRLQHRPAGGKVNGPSPLNTSRLGSEREIEVIFSPCASNWRGIGVCLPPMLLAERTASRNVLVLFYLFIYQAREPTIRCTSLFETSRGGRFGST